jgi:modification methylase
VNLARERLAAIQPQMQFPDEVYRFDEQARPARIPFGALLEAGLLAAGQTLRFRGQAGQAAIILSNGHLHCGALTGSSHGVGKALMNAPSCNGWEHWYYEAQPDEWAPIDQLRAQLRATPMTGEEVLAAQAAAEAEQPVEVALPVALPKSSNGHRRKAALVEG